MDSDEARNPPLAILPAVRHNIMRRQLTILTIIIVGLYSCSTKDSNVQQVTADNSTFSDKDFSSIELFPVDSFSGNKYKIKEINYNIVYLDFYGDKDAERFIARKTTTTEAHTGMEGQNRLIQIDLLPLNNPEKAVLTIKHNCDDIFLEFGNYKTVKYGCCGGEDEYELYDYNNKLILEGNEQIILTRIPNARTKFYVSFKPEYRDTTILGRLHFSYNSSENYQIVIKSDPLPSEQCSPFSPQLFVKTNDKRDRFISVSNEYEIWSLDNIKTKEEINGINLQIVFDCDPELKLDTINIPIINGKPFGKTDKIQEIKYGRQ
ncbi:MAG: hypothetical protein KG029_20405 [Bacteroidetes bacterium]|nr:hypothetical protein [Bacteroidota bacterium]